MDQKTTILQWEYFTRIQSDMTQNQVISSTLTLTD